MVHTRPGVAVAHQGGVLSTASSPTLPSPPGARSCAARWVQLWLRVRSRHRRQTRALRWFWSQEELRVVYVGGDRVGAGAG